MYITEKEHTVIANKLNSLLELININKEDLISNKIGKTIYVTSVMQGEEGYTVHLNMYSTYRKEAIRCLCSLFNISSFLVVVSEPDDRSGVRMCCVFLEDKKYKRLLEAGVLDNIRNFNNCKNNIIQMV